MNCELCATKSGIHDFSLLCCRLRFLRGQPRQNVQGWVERWTKGMGTAKAEAFRRELRDKWQQG